jgi:protein-ribulosamine 3-kinase
MKPGLQRHLETLLSTRLKRQAVVSGGDISQAYALDTAEGRFFCKVNSSPRALEMFLAEHDGLEAIAGSGAIKAPAVTSVGKYEGEAFLLMPFIPSKEPDASDMAAFGEQLAGLHLSGALPLGWPKDNFIGSLPQSNRTHKDWPGFYAQERLLPQLQLAYDRRLLEKGDIPGESMLEAVIRDHCGEVRPSMLHGDLWGGNFIISSEGDPFLIDPAVYVGHNEIDLAMSRLFGGFARGFYEAYENVLPQSPGARERESMYQLYYLLVHLNLFGMSYRPAIRSILSRYFR